MRSAGGLNLAPQQVDQLDTPESTYQATFDTVAGQWSDVLLPWHNFVPVKRATSDPDGERAATSHTLRGDSGGAAAAAAA